MSASYATDTDSKVSRCRVDYTQRITPVHERRKEDPDFWIYFDFMPEAWIIDLLYDKNPRIDSGCDIDIKFLNAYLNMLGYTGIPMYACDNCQKLFNGDINVRWKDTQREDFQFTCLLCHGQLRLYESAVVRRARARIACKNDNKS